MVTSTLTNHVVELTKIAPLPLAELTGNGHFYLEELTKIAPLLLAVMTGKWSFLWVGTQLRTFTFNTWIFI